MDIIKILLSVPYSGNVVDRSLIDSIKSKYRNEFTKLVLRFPNINISRRKNFAYKGNIKMVKILLADPRLDTHYDMIDAILGISAAHNRLKIVKTIFNWGYIKPEYNRCIALKSAILNNHLDMVKFFLKNSNLTDIKEICEVTLDTRNSSMVKLIFMDPRINTPLEDLSFYCSRNHNDIGVRFLLKYYINPEYTRTNLRLGYGQYHSSIIFMDPRYNLYKNDLF